MAEEDNIIVVDKDGTLGSVSADFVRQSGGVAGLEAHGFKRASNADVQRARYQQYVKQNPDEHVKVQLPTNEKGTAPLKMLPEILQGGGKLLPSDREQAAIDARKLAADDAAAQGKVDQAAWGDVDPYARGLANLAMGSSVLGWGVKGLDVATGGKEGLDIQGHLAGYIGGLAKSVYEPTVGALGLAARAEDYAEGQLGMEGGKHKKLVEDLKPLEHIFNGLAVEHPTTSFAGEIGGTAAQFAVPSGPLSAIGEAGKAAESAATISSLGKSGGLVAKALSRIPGVAARGSVESALIGLTHLDKQIEADPNPTVSHYLGVLGEDALWGAGIGVAAEGAGLAGKAVWGRVKNAGVSQAADMMGPLGMMGPHGKTGKNLAGKGLATEGSMVAEKNRLAQEALEADLIKGSKVDTLDAINARKEMVGQEIGQFYLGPAGDAPVPVGKVAGDLYKAAIEGLVPGINDAEIAWAVGKADGFTKSLSLQAGGAATLSARDAWSLKVQFQKQIQSELASLYAGVPDAGMQAPKSLAAVQMYDAITDGIKDSIGTTGLEAGQRAELEALNKQFTDLSDLSRAYAPAAIREAAGGTGGLGRLAWRGAKMATGALAGGALGGTHSLAGAAIGGVGSFLADMAVENSRGLVASSLYRGGKALQMATAAEEARSALRGAANAMLTESRATSLKAEGTLDDRYSKITSALERMSTPEGVTGQAKDLLGPGAGPQVTAETAKMIGMKADYLRPSVPQVKVDPFRSSRGPSDGEKAAFVRKAEGVTEQAFLRRVVSRTLTPEHVTAMKATNPAYLSSLRQEVIKAIGGKTLTDVQRKQVAILFEMPSEDPSLIRQLQSGFDSAKEAKLNDMQQKKMAENDVPARPISTKPFWTETDQAERDKENFR